MYYLLLNMTSNEIKCLVCENLIYLITTPCLCRICNSCQSEWLIQINSTRINSSEFIFSCANGNCSKYNFNSKHIPLEEINTKNILTDKAKKSLNNLYLKKFICQSKDCFSCPTVKCKYSIFMNKEQLEECKNIQIECPKCLIKFKINHSNSNLLKDIYDSSTYEINNFINLSNRKCPKCNVSIHKISGCPHMTCAICQEKFCWDCGFSRDPYSVHKDIHDKKLGLIVYLSLILIFFLLLRIYYSIYAIRILVNYITMLIGNIFYTICQLIFSFVVLCIKVIVILLSFLLYKKYPNNKILLLVTIFDMYLLNSYYTAILNISSFILKYTLSCFYYIILGGLSCYIIIKYLNANTLKIKIVSWGILVYLFNNIIDKVLFN